MGQRLNIEIVKNGDILANSYYHWSGFSNSAVNLAIEIIKHFEYIKKVKVEQYIKNQDLLFAIRLLEETSAGVEDIEQTRKILEDMTMNLKSLPLIFKICILQYFFTFCTHKYIVPFFL